MRKLLLLFKKNNETGQACCALQKVDLRPGLSSGTTLKACPKNLLVIKIAKNRPKHYVKNIVRESGWGEVSQHDFIFFVSICLSTI